MNDPAQRRGYERAVAMLTAARDGDTETFNRLGQEAADAHEFSRVAWSLCGLVDVTLTALSNATGVPADELVQEIAIGVAGEA